MSGKIIFETSWNGMHVAVKETQQTIFLEFDGALNQTSIKKKTPHELQKTYAKEMVQCVKEQDATKRALVLGLGGGVITSWLLRNTEMDITSVEIIPELKKIAETYFHMPSSDRNTVIVTDAFEFVETCTTKYDYIFVDVFDATGTEDRFTSPVFYANLNKINKGTISINSFVTQRNYETYMRKLNHSFDNVFEQYKRLGRYSKNHIAFVND